MARRTTVKNYDADLQSARALFDEKTHFRFNQHYDEDLAEQTEKGIMDALNNEWQRDITLDAWVERVLTDWGVDGRRPIRRSA